MWSSREMLLKCEKLNNAGLKLPIGEGSRVARGFADLGFEEFLILPGDMLLSLFTGKQSPLADDHRQFFFAVPTAAELINQIDRLGWDVASLTFEDRRQWCLKLRHEARTIDREFRAHEIEQVLIEGLFASYTNV